MLGMICSAPIGGILISRFGLRGAAIIFNMCFVVGFLLQIFGTSVIFLIVGRIFLGKLNLEHSKLAASELCHIFQDTAREATG